MVAPLVPDFSHRLCARTSPDWVTAPGFAVPLTPRRRDAVSGWSFRCSSIRVLEDLSVREVGVVGTSLEVKDLLEDSEVRLSELVTVNRVESPRHTPVQQGLSHLGLHHADV